MPRPIYEIAEDIRRDLRKQGKPVPPIAAPYLDAMLQLDGIDGMYYQDSAKNIVRYFLSNAGSYRGPVAKFLKGQLRELVK